MGDWEPLDHCTALDNLVGPPAFLCVMNRIACLEELRKVMHDTLSMVGVSVAEI